MNIYLYRKDCPNQRAFKVVILVLKNLTNSQAPVTHVYNPSFSGSRDQENSGSKPAQANSSARAFLKKSFTKIGLVDWLKVKALSSSLSTTKKKKKEKKKKESYI
jgi:hypothetical protein